ncbi:hypothetical protein [Desulforamulus ruminis]|uniref:Uncharacterized protein n=1 Tax=Desulforamulus ruminis (strain ATCC 23193 / DSM 2154 / NCIMB 8452 / DL) TaxID=696281 RepID=F6DTX7_DESRL|nr:hypothetical protein [Desulforamulus ruminis]AEG58995.1 hypothetical protein Desru_0711 [Desulforamulus ruminis DSM 2154]
MIITGFYVRANKSRIINKSKVKDLIRFCGTALIAVNTAVIGSPNQVMASTGTDVIGRIAGTTFGPGGPGTLIISLLLIALVGWLSGYIAQACGKGQVAGMIHVTTVFSCIALVAESALKALGSLTKFLG